MNAAEELRRAADEEAAWRQHYPAGGTVGDASRSASRAAETRLRDRAARLDREPEIPENEILSDLAERLGNAVRSLETLAEESLSDSERARLAAKQEGVMLALSYVQDALRSR